MKASNFLSNSFVGRNSLRLSPNKCSKRPKQELFAVHSKREAYTQKIKSQLRTIYIHKGKKNKVKTKSVHAFSTKEICVDGLSPVCSTALEWKTGSFRSNAEGRRPHCLSTDEARRLIGLFLLSCVRVSTLLSVRPRLLQDDARLTHWLFLLVCSCVFLCVCVCVCLWGRATERERVR